MRHSTSTALHFPTFNIESYLLSTHVFMQEQQLYPSDCKKMSKRAGVFASFRLIFADTHWNITVLLLSIYAYNEIDPVDIQTLFRIISRSKPGNSSPTPDC